MARKQNQTIRTIRDVSHVTCQVPGNSFQSINFGGVITSVLDCSGESKRIFRVAYP